MFARLSILFSLAIGLAASTARLHAQSNELDPEFQRIVTEAVVEYEAGRYPEAQALFRRAHERAPNARTLRGLGMASFELRQYALAFRALSGALEETRFALTGEQRAQVQDLLERTRHFVTRVQLELSPAQANVRLDGAAPVRELDGTVLLDSGHHVFDASADGYLPRSMSLDAQGGEEASLAFELTRIPVVLVPEPAPPRPDEGLIIGAVAVFSASALIAGASAVTGALALDGQGQLQRTCNVYVCPDSATPTLERTHALSIATDVLWVSAAIAGATGLALLLGALLNPHSPTLRATAGCHWAGCALLVEGSL